MATRKTKSPRRREVRRHIDTPRHAWAAWLARREIYYATLYVLLFTVLATLMIRVGRDRLAYREGQPIDAPIVARVGFVSINKLETETKRQQAYEQQPAVYKMNDAYREAVKDKLTQFVMIAADESIQSVDQISPEQREALQLDEKAFERLRSFLADGQPTLQWTARTDDLLSDLGNVVILNSDDAFRERNEAKVFHIKMQKPDGEDGRSSNSILSMTDPPQTIENNIRPFVASRFPNDLRDSIVALIMDGVQPTYLLNDKETENRRKARRDAVEDVLMTYAPNDVLVTPGLEDHRRFSDLDLDMIRQERQAYRAQIGPILRALEVAGAAGIALLMAVSMWVYFAAYYPRVVSNAMRGGAVTLLLLAAQALGLGLTTWGAQFTYFGGLLPTIVATIILTIAYDQRLALTVGAIHALLITFALNLPLGFLLVLLFGVAMAVGQLNEVRTRSKLVLTGVWTGLAMAAGVAMMGLLDRPMHVFGVENFIVRDTLLALATGFGAGLFVQGILPGIERVFRVSTSMTLKELNDASHPLLRRLAELAPGTYQHSLRLADLGEAAAEAIGADSLKCRVGAMYHDIGKMNKPDYFVENITGGPNKHDKLSPAMSLLIIVGHVKDGIEMAREYRLPQSIRHFVESHHGTTLVEFFYHAAVKQTEANGKADRVQPSEFEFRYPGPKPQTKEAAIIMVCDTIESASRSQPEHTAAKIEQLVHQMAMKRLMDGQFDECNLTLQELHSIEDAITKTLRAIYHGRVAYPGAEATPQTPPAEAEQPTAPPHAEPGDEQVA